MASVPLWGAPGLWGSCCRVSSKAPDRALSAPCGPPRLTVRSGRHLPPRFPPDVRLSEPRQHGNLDLRMAADRAGGAELARRFRHRQPVQPRRRDDRGLPVAGHRAAAAADPACPPRSRRGGLFTGPHHFVSLVAALTDILFLFL